MSTVQKDATEDTEPITLEDDTFNAFADKTIRRGFIRKVYSILMVQLLITTSLVAFVVFHEPSRVYLSQHTEYAFASWITSFVIMLVISCFENARRKAPTNFILLGVFTVAMAITLSFTATVYYPFEILLAAGITAVICFALTVFAFQTKWDFTVLGGALFISVILLFLFGIVSLIFRSHVMEMLYAAIGAFLFSVYLIYDTQLIIGGHHKYSISPEEYIFAALSLYLDIINIFLKILRLVRA